MAHCIFNQKLKITLNNKIPKIKKKYYFWNYSIFETIFALRNLKLTICNLMFNCNKLVFGNVNYCPFNNVMESYY